MSAPFDTLALLFSRDRAMQVDATLRSYFLHAHDPHATPITVIYKASDARHAAQYAQLAHDYANRPVRFHPQTLFRADVLDALHGTPRALNRWGAWAGWLNLLAPPRGGPTYVLFLVDDNLFVRDFALAAARAALAADAHALGFSLRLGHNTTYCYPAKRTQTLPAFTASPAAASPAVSEISGTPVGTTHLAFTWPDADGDFGYPLEVSSSLYRIADLRPTLERTPFRHPNDLEARLAGRASAFRTSHPRLLCWPQSATFCNPINMVQKEYKNRAGELHAHTSDELAERFARGQRINVRAYTDFVPTGCHQETELIFESV